MGRKAINGNNGNPSGFLNSSRRTVAMDWPDARTKNHVSSSATPPVRRHSSVRIIVIAVSIAIPIALLLAAIPASSIRP